MDGSHFYSRSRGPDKQRHSIPMKEEQRISFNLLMAGHYSHAVSVENWATVRLLLLKMLNNWWKERTVRYWVVLFINQGKFGNHTHIMFGKLFCQINPRAEKSHIYVVKNIFVFAYDPIMSEEVAVDRARQKKKMRTVLPIFSFPGKQFPISEWFGQSLPLISWPSSCKNILTSNVN